MARTGVTPPQQAGPALAIQWQTPQTPLSLQTTAALNMARTLRSTAELLGSTKEEA